MKKKNFLKFVVLVSLVLFASEARCSVDLKFGDTFTVNEDCYVPLFSLPSAGFSCVLVEHGVCCDELETVLLPGSGVNILKVITNEIVKVDCDISQSYRARGYVHLDFFEKSMTKGRSVAFACKSFVRIPMSMSEIEKVFQRCLKEGPQYCYGANNFEPIDINDMYDFTCKNTNGDLLQNTKYILKGFDCSGILHFISNGVLPHCTKGLDEAGKRLFVFDRKVLYSDEEKSKILAQLKDTDYLVFICNTITGFGHVIISYKDGFFEFTYPGGCVYTNQQEAIARLDKLIADGKKIDSDVFVIRWHPELLAE